MENPPEQNTMLRRFQFGLSGLASLITVLCIVFAFPRITLTGLGLLVAALFALLVFYLAFFLPVAWICRRIGNSFHATRESACTDPSSSHEEHP